MNKHALLTLTEEEAIKALEEKGLSLKAVEHTTPPRGPRENVVLRVVDVRFDEDGVVLLVSGFLPPAFTP